MKRWILRLSASLAILLLATSFALGADDLPKLGTATELIWGREYYVQDQNTFWRDFPGCASWKPADLDLNRYVVNVYNDQNEFISTYKRTIPETVKIDHENSMVFNYVHDLPSGRYYFTVQALGDGVTYADGDIVRSDYFDYVKPEQSCAAIDDVYWDGTQIRWTDVMDTEGFYHFNWELYREDTVTETPSHRIYYGYTYTNSYDAGKYLTKPGYYYFRVCVKTNDMTKYATGPWAATRTPYFVGDTVVSTENDLVKAVFNHSAEDLSVMATVSPISEPVMLLAATYDASGRFLGLDMEHLNSSEKEQTVFLTPETDGAAEATLSIIDENLVPIDKALEASF